MLCIDAVELSTSGGHYAALGLPASPYPLGGEPADVVEDVARMGGFGIVTHPDSPRPSLAWKGSLAQADGLEWLNGDSAWRDESWLRLAGVVFHYPWRPAEVIAQTLDSAGAALARWDREARVRPTVAIAGNDAHGGFSLDAGERDYEARPVVRLPGYAASFGLFSLVVSPSAALTGDAAEDARLVVSAVRRGHLATVIDGFAKPGAFTFTASSGTATAQQGDRIAPSGPVRLVARSNAPAGLTIVLKRDGREIGRWTDAALHHLVGPERAAYRVEILAVRGGEDARRAMGDEQSDLRRVRAVADRSNRRGRRLARS